MTNSNATIKAWKWSARVNLPAYIYQMANSQWYVAYDRAVANMKSARVTTIEANKWPLKYKRRKKR